MLTNSIVLMTALVPTIGHLDLIRFANAITKDHTFVIVQGRSFEPIETYDRVRALRDQFGWNGEQGITILMDVDDGAPQNPRPELEAAGGDSEFWGYWNLRVRSMLHKVSQDVDSSWGIVASELYGMKLAARMGIHFIPYDIAREVADVSGTRVRNNIIDNWEYIAPTFRANLKSNFVIFGQESVGKTTISKALGRGWNNQQFIPEYARGYLEAVGAELSDEKMRWIACGQRALQSNAIRSIKAPINIFDTDLLSTIGYHRIHGDLYEDIRNKNPELIPSFYSWLNIGNPVYFLLPDDVPFEVDPLRYGGDKRESGYQFWKMLLEECACDFIEVPTGSLNSKIDFIQMYIDQHVDAQHSSIKKFKRE